MKYFKQIQWSNLFYPKTYAKNVDLEIFVEGAIRLCITLKLKGNTHII